MAAPSINKKFLNSSKTANTSKSILGILEAYEEWLIAKIPETKELLQQAKNSDDPKEAFIKIQDAVFAHSAIRDAETKSHTRTGGKTGGRPQGPPKNHVSVIMTSKDEQIESKSFDLPQQALRWAQRKLIEEAPGTYAIVVDRRFDFQERVDRDDAMLAIFAKKPQQINKKMGVSNRELGFGTKAKGDRFHFSRG